MPVLKKSYRLSHLALLLAVYSTFFAVQFFFNFEAFSNNGVFAQQTQVSGSLTSRTTLAQQHSPQSSHPVSFRLNKRFQQEDMPPCQLLSVPAPFRFITVRKLGFCPNPNLPSVDPIHTLQRGPPVNG